MTASPPPADPFTRSESPSADNAPAASPSPSPPAAVDPAPSSPSQQPADAQAAEEDGQAEQKQSKEEEPAKADAWQAVFSAEANAWYFWNAETNETTWSNPREASASETTSAPPAEPEASPTAPDTLPEIDPELAWLDPAAAARGGKSGGGAGGLTQAARFNARTGRFQADPAMNPDRISDFQRGQRQQEAYYDVAGWEQSLEGKGIKRAGVGSAAGEEGSKKRPSSKEIERFRKNKEDKKRKKLATWLGS
ncbi:hypothetical protein JCM10213_004225 [Rhodosporidiobolus nylandii]